MKTFLKCLGLITITFFSIGSLNAETNGQKPRVAVVLSGGAAYGFTHVGVLEVIEEAGIPIDMVVGTSIGSIIGGLYVSGYSPDEIARVAASVDWTAAFNDPGGNVSADFEKKKRNRYPVSLAFNKNGLKFDSGLMKGQNISTLFESFTIPVLAVSNFNDLPVPYRAVAVDILSGEEVVLSNGSVADAMRASMSLPAIFKAYTLDGHVLIDGGVVDNMPVDVARQMGADIVIAVELQRPLISNPEDLKSPLDAALQTESLFVKQNVDRMRPKADLVIAPDLNGYSSTDFKKSAELIARGKKAAEERIADLKKLSSSIAASRPLLRPEEQKNRLVRVSNAVKLAKIRFEGALPEDRKALLKIAGTNDNFLTANWIASKSEAIYDLQKYDLARFTVERAANGLEGVFYLTPDLTPSNFIYAGLQYQYRYAKMAAGNLDLGLGFTVEDLTGKQSALFISGKIVDSPGFYAEYFQPLGPYFFLSPFFEYQEENDDFPIDESTRLSFVYRAVRGGIWTGTTIGRISELKIGYIFENVYSMSDFFSTNSENVGSLRLLWEVDTRDALVFPENGFFGALTLQKGDPSFGGESVYQKAGVDCGFYFSPTRRVTFGLTASAGTDGTFWNTSLPHLRTYRSFNLSNPWQFTGIGTFEAFGSHKLAGGVDMALRPLPDVKILGSDLYMLFNYSAGNCLTFDQTPDEFFPFRWEASAGLGLRFSPSFGLALKAHVIEVTNYSITFNAGSFSPDFGGNR